MSGAHFRLKESGFSLFPFVSFETKAAWLAGRPGGRPRAVIAVPLLRRHLARYEHEGAALAPLPRAVLPRAPRTTTDRAHHRRVAENEALLDACPHIEAAHLNATRPLPATTSFTTRVPRRPRVTPPSSTANSQAGHSQNTLLNGRAAPRRDQRGRQDASLGT